MRLKWGDPFVFDSGGKEALFLHEQQIPFEVVPGIPATIGVPAYAGIPITYPGAGDVVTLVRGHEAETDEPPKVDWARLAGLDGTLVCYAGRAADRRDRQCAPDERPLARGVRGARSTTGRRRRRRRSSARSARSSSARGRTEPAMLVIGAVVGLREHLRWFDDRPLFGRRIVVTRSREQAGELVDMLEERGAEVIQAPTIRIAPPEDAGGARSRRAPTPAPTTGSCSRAPTPSTTSCSGCSRTATSAI